MADEKKFVPFISSDTVMSEFTVRGLIIGLILAVVLGAANAYLGLKAGMTIAATYPAAVIGMAILKWLKGTILEENFTRTVGSIGESIAAGAVFTLPAFFISGVWEDFYTPGHYLISFLIMVTGGILGIMFVALLRRVMVHDQDLPFPESIAASEIHKSGRESSGSSKFLFWSMGLGALVKTMTEFKFFAATWEKFVMFAQGKVAFLGLGNTGANTYGGALLSSPGLKPAYIGVGYIIGPRLAALNFSGGVLAWGLLTPIILYFIAPYLDFEAIKNWVIASNLGLSGDAAAQFHATKESIITALTANNAGLTAQAAAEKATHILAEAPEKAWTATAYQVWIWIVKPIAIGGMLVGTAYTLWNMRQSLITGIKRSISDVKKAAAGSGDAEIRTEKDISFTWIMLGIAGAALATFLITFFVFQTALYVAIITTIVMIIAGFFFGAVSGYLVGIIGSSNNPISGLTISTVVVTALVMLILGVTGSEGVASVLGVAAIVCVSAAVAGEMLQDLKAGHILGGTPWKMQVGDLIGVVVAAAVMFIPLMILHEGDIAKGLQEGYVGGFGSRELSAPQAGLMAFLSKGIIGGKMAWPLIITGMLMGVAFILMKVKSPMLVAIGMYLPLETTFAIFIGGLIKGIADSYVEKRQYNETQRSTYENTGILIASGLIAGEALMGLVFAGLAFMEIKLWAFPYESFITSLFVFAFLGWVLVKFPLSNAVKE
jgi:OPT family oligopeptide transporter